MNMPGNTLEWLSAATESEGYHRLDSYARLVLLILWQHADRQTLEAWPGVDRIARLAGMNSKTVRRCLRDILETGLIGRELRPGRSPIYRLGQLTPLPPDGYTRQTGIPTGRVDTPTTRWEGNPLSNPPENQKEKTHTLGAITPDHIARLLAAYPKHRGRSEVARPFVEAARDVADDRRVTEADAAEWIIARAESHWAHLRSVVTGNPAESRYVRGLRAWLTDGTFAVEPGVAFAHLADDHKPGRHERPEHGLAEYDASWLTGGAA